MPFTLLAAWDPYAVKRQPPVSIRSITRAAVLLAALSAAGCSLSPPPEFELNLEGRDPDEISLTQVDAITEMLEELFGTPDDVTIPDGLELDLGLLRAAAGPIDRTGEPDAQRGLYRQHCAVCHGTSGDGAGPTASLLTPYPRDFRNGTFKYTSTLAGAKPTGQDLERTLVSGISGTAMPSFAELQSRELAAVLEYVEYLSIRGETELFLIELVVDEDEYLPLGVDAKEIVLEDGALWAAALWAAPEDDPEAHVVEPPATPSVERPELLAASIARGHELYSAEDAQCVKCHGPNGAGDGEDQELYDDWNKRKIGVTPEKTRELARLFTLPLQRLRARDFREGAFRGGDRPKDLYWRIHVGIKGTPMPPVGPAPGTAGALQPEEIWHVVNYVRSLVE